MWFNKWKFCNFSLLNIGIWDHSSQSSKLVPFSSTVNTCSRISVVITFLTDVLLSMWEKAQRQRLQIIFQIYLLLILISCIILALYAYDRVSDVVESCVRFANKILTHHRMHWHWSTIAHLKANMPRIQNMYNMYRAKVDRLAGKNYFLQKMA